MTEKEARQFTQNVMLRFGEVAALSLCVLLYSIYASVQFGFGSEFLAYTYLPFGGSVLCIAGAFLYSVALSKLPNDSRPPKRSWSRPLAIEAGLLPYFFGLYIFGFFGLYGLLLSLHPFAGGSFIAALLWIFIGHRILYQTWLLSELGNAAR